MYNNNQTWNAYKVEAWPTIVLLDKQERIRCTHVGEGDYDQAERFNSAPVCRKTNLAVIAAMMNPKAQAAFIT